MIRPAGIKKCGRRYFDKVVKTCGGKLKMMTIAPELKGAMAIIKDLRARGAIASFGHSDADYEEALKGIRAGINHVTHIFNAMRPLHHRKPAGLGAVLADDGVSVQLISDGVHIHPAVVGLIVGLKGVRNIILITDSMSSQGMPGGRYAYDGLEYVSRAGACRYKDGTLIGTALPLNKMVQRFMRFGGVSLCDAVQAATANPARVLGIDKQKGSIQEGKDADVVIMDKDFNVEMTIIGGEIVYGKERTGGS
jgi:N-acetylglucosamine-6-phosphate deacetylase